MKYITTCIIGAIALAAAFLATGCSRNMEGYYSHDGITQGTTFHIVFELNGSTAAQKLSYSAVCDSIELFLKDIDFALSGYNKSSILTMFNENPDSLYRLLNTPKKNAAFLRRYNIFLDNFLLAQEAYRLTDGKVDCSAAPLFDLWGFGFKKGIEVTQKEIDSVKSFIGMDNFTLSTKRLYHVSDKESERLGQTIIIVTKKERRCRLNFNAVAQGYTADYIGSHFSAMGIENYLIEVGGEIFVKGLNAKGEKWRVGIDRPEDGNNTSGEKVQEIIEIGEGGLVTSGDYRKFYIKDGKKISHTINPETGYPVEHNLLSATILAPTSALADIYATYCMVIGLEDAIEFVQRDESVTNAVLIYSTLENSATHSASDSLAVWKYNSLPPASDDKDRKE